MGPGPVYGEPVKSVEGRPVRLWSPARSKLGSLLLMRGGRSLLLGRTPRAVLYLGAASGTTVSHACDLYPDAPVFAVEVASRPIRQLLDRASGRPNLVPVMADAARPELYRHLTGNPPGGGVDLIYQDVAQRDQAGIFRANWPILREGGLAILMLKTRSVDSAEDPETVLAGAEAALADLGRVRRFDLRAYHGDHWALAVER